MWRRGGIRKFHPRRAEGRRQEQAGHLWPGAVTQIQGRWQERLGYPGGALAAWTTAIAGPMVEQGHSRSAASPLSQWMCVGYSPHTYIPITPVRKNGILGSFAVA